VTTPGTCLQRNIDDSQVVRGFDVEMSTALTEAMARQIPIGQTAARPISAEAAERLGRLPRRKNCRCGQCGWCLENTRWDRILVRRSDLLRAAAEGGC
jgi:hypothetical protein